MKKVNDAILDECILASASEEDDYLNEHVSVLIGRFHGLGRLGALELLAKIGMLLNGDLYEFKYMYQVLKDEKEKIKNSLLLQ